MSKQDHIGLDLRAGAVKIVQFVFHIIHMTMCIKYFGYSAGKAAGKRRGCSKIAVAARAEEPAFRIDALHLFQLDGAVAQMDKKIRRIAVFFHQRMQRVKIPVGIRCHNNPHRV